MAEAVESTDGLILRGSDGSLYYIRNEVLEACKTEGEHREHVEEWLEGDNEVEGFALSLGPTSSFETVGSVSSVGGVGSPSLPSATRHTIMCPW